MSEAKKLLVGLQLDTKQGDKLSSLFKNWNKEAKDLTKTFAGLKLGNLTTSSGKNSLLQQVEDTVKGLGRLGKVSQDAAKLMREGINRELEDQKTLLKELEQAYQSAERKYQTAAQYRQRVEQRYGSNSPQAQRAGQFEGARRERYFGAYNQMNEQRNSLSGSGDGPGGGFLTSALARYLGPAALAGVALNRVGHLEGDFDKLDMLPFKQRAQVEGLESGIKSRFQGGDLSDTYAFSRLMSDPRLKKRFADMTNDKGFRRQFGSAVDTIKNIPTLDYAGAMEAMGQMSPKSAEAFQAALGLTKTSMQDEISALGAVGGAASNRQSFARRMGNSGVLGSNGLLRRGQGMGFFQDEVMGVSTGILETGGKRAANDLTEKALDAIRKGMSQGAAVAIAGGAVMGGSAGRILEHFAALGSQAGGDAVAMGRAGQFTAAQVQNGFGISGTGVAAFMGGGSVADERFREQALGALGQITQGNTSYGKIRSRMSAMRAAPSAGLYAQKAIAELDPSVLADILDGGEGSVPGWLAAQFPGGAKAAAAAVKTFAASRNDGRDLMIGDEARGDLGVLTRAIQSGSVSEDDIRSGKVKTLPGMSGSLDSAFQAYNQQAYGISPSTSSELTKGYSQLGKGLATGGTDAAAGSTESGAKNAQIAGEIMQWETIRTKVAPVMSDTLQWFEKLNGAVHVLVDALHRGEAPNVQRESAADTAARHPHYQGADPTPRVVPHPTRKRAQPAGN